ncbi:MAG: SPASM domain-containing protein, partial [Hyphomicrobiales bacterium]|nr:SPASM domain-containing protein [Hyphomicrobiales bacterium]
LVASPQMRKFGDDKRDTLTKQCRECDVRFLCNGGCPKDRFALSKDGEPGQNYLCAGLELFFTHTRPLMGVMGQLLKRGRAPADVMLWVKAEDAKRDPYAPCPCGGGRKFKFCHGDKAPSKKIA